MIQRLLRRQAPSLDEHSISAGPHHYPSTFSLSIFSSNFFFEGPVRHSMLERLTFDGMSKLCWFKES